MRVAMEIKVIATAIMMVKRKEKMAYYLFSKRSNKISSSCVHFTYVDFAKLT
jgi:hypothetical protein